MAEISRIRPFLWFDGQAQEAMEYYVSVFPNSSIDQVVPVSYTHLTLPTTPYV